MKKVISLPDVGNIINDFVLANEEFLEGIDFVVGVSRGGLVPAALLAAKIDKPLAAAYINKKDEIYFDRADWISGKNILVVDDVVRSGKTLWLVKKHLGENTIPGSVSFFTLFKLKSLLNESYNINISAREINEDIIFPWDNDRKYV